MGYVSETAAYLLGLCCLSSAAASGKSHEIPLLWPVGVVFKSELPSPEVCLTVTFRYGYRCLLIQKTITQQ